MAREVCPNCGAALPRKAKACPECGADEETGWSEDAATGGLDLPDEDFNYEEFVSNEFSPKKEIKPRGLHWIWWITGVLLLATIIYWFLRNVF